MSDRKKNKLQLQTIQYEGNKRKEVHFIQESLPDLSKITHMVDAFGGSGSVSLYFLQTTDKQIIYNEIAPYMFELFQCLKDKPKLEQVIKEYNSIPLSMETLRETRKKWNNGEQSLLNFFLMKSMCFRGILTASTPNMRKIDGVNVLNLRPIRSDKLINISDLVATDRYNIMNQNAIDLIEKHRNDEGYFFYLDPPYLEKNATSDCFYNRFSMEDIRHIIRLINDDTVKCKIMLHIDFTGYTYSEMMGRLKKLYPKTFTIWNGASGGRGITCYGKYNAIFTNY